MTKNFFFRLGIGTLLLALILIFEYYSDWDTRIQEFFFDRGQNRWIIDPERHKQLGIFFYSGLKNMLILIAAFCLARLLASIRFKQLRPNNKAYAILLLSIIFVPAIVAGAKYVTNVYCPYQLAIYNGQYPFVRILETYPDDFTQPKPGRCFPAGHATAGFALMALFYFFKTPRRRWLGLGLGLLLGWTAGIYQMLRGQHFLSHTLFSMVASFMVIMTANEFVCRCKFHRPKHPPQTTTD